MSVLMESNATIPRLCLNMIVKNESKVITRLFDSVASIIDSYCICDTGSTDNTIDLITEYFKEKGIPGRVIRVPFRDFGYNRTVAMNACEDMPDVDYLLLLDADMVLRISPDFKADEFKLRIAKKPAHYVFQGTDHFFYRNIRIVKNGYSKSYWGVTHEYIKLASGTDCGMFQKDEVFIEDIGDGGAKSDKYERDIRLLTRGLEEEPDNDRYTFYLANSLRDAGHHERAIEAFKKRISLGGWFEEIWYSYYSMGTCYQKLGNIECAVYNWAMASTITPERIENLYKIINHYREIGKNELAYMYFQLADKKRKMIKHNDYLFFEKDIYDYKLDYELSIIGYYCNYDSHDLGKVSMKVLRENAVPDWMANNVLSNYKFYSPRLLNCSLRVVEYKVPLESTDFVSSTPSITYHDGKLAMNIRTVNYSIDDKGGYVQKSTISTENLLYQFPTIEDVMNAENPSDFFMKKQYYDDSLDGLFVGVEDIRLFSHNGQLYYNGNRGLEYNNMVVEHGTISMEAQPEKVRAEWSKQLTMIGQHTTEKNWVLFEDSQQSMKCIYYWHPLQIGDIDAENAKLIITHRIETPVFFKHLRCSTNGVRIGDELWFICHLVSYEDRRYYYHIIVVLDPTTYEVLRYTRLFTFEGEKVEYTLGFVYDENRKNLIIGYSTMDNCTKFMEIAKDAIENMYFLQ